jgi:hypothetical protein
MMELPISGKFPKISSVWKKIGKIGNLKLRVTF